MKYGIPYMGSKSRIAKDLIKIFPTATHFYDIFGGGFSVTHAMFEHRKDDFKEFHFNEIRNGICELIQDSINGKYSYKTFTPHFISREQFFAEKDINAYVNVCWSFGNDCRSYLYGKNIESQKKSLHEAVVFNKFDDFAVKMLGIDSFGEITNIKERRLQANKLIPRMRLQSLERLERLERLQTLYFTNKSFENVQIKQNSVIYLDPPYLGTAKYDENKHFNRKLFLEWADSLTEPVFISEYSLELPTFKEIWHKHTESTLSSYTVKKTVEKVFANKQAIELIEAQSKMFRLT